MFYSPISPSAWGHSLRARVSLPYLCTWAPAPAFHGCLLDTWVNAMLLRCKTLIKFLFSRFQRKQAIEYYKQVIKIKENAGTLANSSLVRNQLSISLSDTLCKLGNCFDIFLLEADDFSLYLTCILCLFLNSLHLWSQQLLFHIIFNFLSLFLSLFLLLIYFPSLDKCLSLLL